MSQVSAQRLTRVEAKAETRQRLLRAAAVFANRGYGDASMNAMPILGHGRRSLAEQIAEPADDSAPRMTS